jgi:hypothetical protein
MRTETEEDNNNNNLGARFVEGRAAAGVVVARRAGGEA